MEKTTHIGSPGTRVVVAGRVVSVQRVDTDYGHSALVLLENSEGVFARWLSSNGDLAYTLRRGDPLTVRATVKGYVVRDDRLWVQITRGRIETDALTLV